MTRQKFKGDPQQVLHPAACYIDIPSLDPLLRTISTERYTAVTVALSTETHLKVA